MSYLPDPTERVPYGEDWPCGCAEESECRHIRPCEMHQYIPEDRLWAVLEATFPDLPDLSIPEFDDEHCPRCGAEFPWKGRTEAQRLCGSCRWGE